VTFSNSMGRYADPASPEPGSRETRRTVEQAGAADVVAKAE
jgi:hypothetical protein